jgi:PadR family transcriptional regulator, regulatory protein PadR
MNETTDGHKEISSWCGAAPGRMPGFVQPWLLLLLSEAPAHGYQLLERLHQNPDTAGIDPGFVYRTLRQFEDEGYVKSAWDVEARGPARRVYELTTTGVTYLHQWAEHVRGARERLGRLLQSYETYCVRGTEQKEGEARE